MPNRIDSGLQSIYKTWLNNANPAVKQQLIRSRRVSGFTENVNRQHSLSRKQRLTIVNQALILLEQTYVHLPLKRAIHAIDPVQRLRVLRFRVEQGRQAEISEIEFHREMQEVFASVRDRHTQYLLPAPFDGHVAYLPFLVEDYHEKNEQRFMVSHVAEGFRHSTFRRGVELLHWNGVPMKRAIENNGEMQAGSNAEAQFARGLDALTIRDLKFSLPPHEEWVVISYLTNNGPEEIKLEWLVVPVTAGTSRRRRRRSGSGARTKLAIDRHKAGINQMRKSLYAPDVVAAEKKVASYKKKHKKLGRIKCKRYALETSLPDVFLARRVWNRKLGYIRIFSFESDIDGVGPDEMVKEFVRLVCKLETPDGLIIDVRGNPGGFINAGERLLQLFTPHRIEPELFEFINTTLTLQICRRAPRDEEMSQFAKSISESVMTGATYSAGFPLTSIEDSNAIGQIYYGPVVLITDALCYSTTDMFTAGFQDNRIGTVLGTSGNIGAGGANVYDHDDLVKWLRKNPKAPFRPLPKGASMRVALRRSLRVGKSSGRPLEALGVTPDVPYQMTKRDLRDNRDLIDEAAKMLSKQPVRKLSVERRPNSDGSRFVTVSVQNIHRLEIKLNNRPQKPASTSQDRRSGTRKYTLEIPPGPEVALLLEGFNRRNKPVAMSRQKV